MSNLISISISSTNWPLKVLLIINIIYCKLSLDNFFVAIRYFIFYFTSLTSSFLILVKFKLFLFYSIKTIDAILVDKIIVKK